MIKNYHILCLCLILISCADKVEQKKGGKDEEEVPKTEEPQVVVETTEYQYDPVSAPDGYVLEWVEDRDTSTCTLFRKQIFQPVDSTVANLKFIKFVEEAIDRHITHDMIYVDPCPQPYPKVQYEGTYGVSKIFMGDQVISIQYINDTYGFGGNHHNYGYFSVNYNLRDSRELQFSDFLKLDNKKDTADFVLLLDQNQATQECMTIDSFSSKWDFNLTEEGVQFSDYSPWSCSLNYSFLTWAHLRESGFLQPFFYEKYIAVED